MDVKIIREEKISVHSNQRRDKSVRHRVEDQVEKYMERGYSVKAMDYDHEKEEYRVLMTKSSNNPA